MAKVVYNDPEGVAESVTFHGHAMTAGQEIEIEDTAEHQAFLDAAEGNPYFTVTDRKELKEGEEAPPPKKHENRQLTPYDRGQLAKEDGKPRSVPVFYRGKDESEEWLKGYDGEESGTVATAEPGGIVGPAVGPMSAGSSSAFSSPQGTGQADQNTDFSQGQNAALGPGAPRPVDGSSAPSQSAQTGQQTQQGQQQSADLTGGRIAT